ncbi:MAG: hypothetical protein ACP5JW_00305 [Candidatus Bathyarchaeia archaeon]
MSEEGSIGITAAEKFFGIILIIVGALATYFTLTSSNVLSVYTWFFGFLSLVLLALGIFLIIAKAE